MTAPSPDEPGARPPSDMVADHRSGMVADPEPDRPVRRFFGRLWVTVRELVVVVVLALGLSLIVKTFLVQAFWIPSGSMENTLIVNDRVLVSKLTPNPVDLKRGDIVVFSDPDQWLAPMPRGDHGAILNGLRDLLTFVGLVPSASDDHLIKRVIGMPGDHVVCCDDQHRLSINGTAVDEPYVHSGENASDIAFDITVPAGKVWVMGDNRANSEDSRFHDSAGTGADGSVPIADVTGRAFVTVWPLNRFGWLSNHADAYAEVPAPSGASSP